MDVAKELEEKRKEFREKEASLENVTTEISFYESFIPNFFSVNGEAEGIRMMYETVEDKEEMTIECVDVNKSGSIYQEYLEGMKSFLTDISQSSSTVSEFTMESFQEKMNTAKNNDTLFIESLFNGSPEINPKVSTKLTEAVQNVEYLIDFVPQMKQMKETCESVSSLLDNIPENESTKHSLIQEGLNMMYESVGNYCSSMLSAVLTDYNMINSMINPSNPVERNFQLF